MKLSINKQNSIIIATRKVVIYSTVAIIIGLLLSCGNKVSREHENVMEAGVTRLDITPSIGYKVHNITSDGILDPLEVKSIVMQQNECQAALVLADLFYMPLELSEIVRKLASLKTGIPVANICVAATHTHADPTCYEEIEEYIHKKNSNKLTAEDKVSYPAMLIEKMVNSIANAKSKLQPVNIKSGIINIEDISFNRRHLMKDGQIVMNAGFLNPKTVRSVGPIDPELGVILFNSIKEDKSIASFSTFAMQLATIGNTTKFSSDFPHFMEKKLQTQLGDDFISVFGEGPSADVNHWDITKPGPQIGYEEMTKPVGEKIGISLLQGFSELKERNTSLAVMSKTINVPLQTYSEMDLEWAKSFTETDASLILKTRVRKILHLEKLRKKFGDLIPFEIQVFAFNAETAIVTLPGQIFVELGLELKKNSPFKNTLILTLANNHEETIPIRKAFPEGSYEIVYSLIDSGGGEMLIEEALSLLNELNYTENKKDISCRAYYK